MPFSGGIQLFSRDNAIKLSGFYSPRNGTGTNTHFTPGGRVIIHLQPYGWFTGHYMLFDDVVVESWN